MTRDPGSAVLGPRNEYFHRLTTMFDAARKDGAGRPYRDRFLRRKLKLGLFLPNMSGGGFATHLDSGTEPTYEYNLACARRADEGDFDFIFPVGRWAGDGGATWYNEFSLEGLTLTSALAANTQHVMVFTTWHVGYHFHPMHVAKMGATLDHISSGRWGLNIVTGWKGREAAMFGKPLAPHEARYAVAAEFVAMLKDLWSADAPIELKGRYFGGSGCLVLPKPVQRPQPLLINAGQSADGVAFATQHCDIVFVQGGKGEIEDVAAIVERVRGEAASRERDVQIIMSAVFVCRDTEQEALSVREEILANGDYEAAENMLRALGAGSESWSRHTIEQVVLGLGGFKFFGTPDQAVDVMQRLEAAGVDGVQLKFWRYYEEIGYFVDHVLPLMKQAGLREFVDEPRGVSRGAGMVR